MQLPFHSLRWRLQAWHGLILLLVIVALCGAVHRLATVHEFQRIDREVVAAERALVRGLIDAWRPADLPEGPLSPRFVFERLRAGDATVPSAVAARFSGTEPGHVYFVIRDADGKILLRSDNAPAGRVPTPSAASSEFSDNLRTVGRHRELHRATSDGVAVLVGRDISAEQDQMLRFTAWLAAVGLGVWLLGLLGGWWLAGRAIRPVDSISRTATRIAEGNLDERIDTADTDSELDQLGRVLNQTFDRLHDSFERQRRFTADAAHELRTPVSILLSETQRILRRERSAGEYREALQTCHDTAGRMRRLVEALLLLARLENNSVAPRRERLDLAVVADDTARHLAPLAEERRVTIHTELSPAVCLGDPDALGILVTNLVANALQHHRPEGGSVWLRTQLESGRAVLVVRDDGPGIPGKNLPHIFERFHRADSARTGGSGHTGLGLAIAKTIADNHQGELAATSRPGEGATFTLSLPADASDDTRAERDARP